MRSHNFAGLRRASVLTGLLLAAACSSDSVSAPILTPAPANLAKVIDPLIAGEIQVKTGGRLGRLKDDVEAIAFIGPQGGVLRIPELGFELVVPKGAVSNTMKFRVTALAGGTLAYEFEPHGAKFNVPLTFRQDARYTRVGRGQVVGGGYFTDRTRFNQNGKLAAVAETIPGRWSDNWIEFDIWHFSGYLVSCG